MRRPHARLLCFSSLAGLMSPVATHSVAPGRLHPAAVLTHGRLASSSVAMTTGATAATAVVTERSEGVRKPPLDTRSYRHVTLSNGLHALLVHDPKTDRAAAAIEVRAGHFSDPADRPGLAHLTEHMMFLGTAFEPDEGAFKAFLQKNGGSSNAFTGMEATGFHFSVHPSQVAL